MTQSAHNSGSTKGPLDAAQKIVAELHGMPNEQQALALKFATETLGLELPTTHAQAMQTSVLSSKIAQPIVPVMPGQRTDIKTFTGTKDPKSDQQFAAVVAYYYQFEAPADQMKESIDAATMKEAARQAGRKQVKNWNLTLDNARRSGFLDKAERGAFKLNAVGENLVAITLPGKAAPSNSGGLKKRPANKKKPTGKKRAKNG